MEYLLLLVEYVGNAVATVVDVIQDIPLYFEQGFIYLNAWIVKVRFQMLVWSLEISYKTAVYLLEDIGFTSLVTSTFNALPSELRYYAFAFRIPEAISILFNCMATAFVMKSSRF